MNFFFMLLMAAAMAAKGIEQYRVDAENRSRFVHEVNRNQMRFPMSPFLPVLRFTEAPPLGESQVLASESLSLAIRSFGVETMYEPPVFPPFGIANDERFAIGVEMLSAMVWVLAHYRYRRVREVVRFLRHLGLENHLDALRYVDMGGLRGMSDQDLQNLGLPDDAREKILEAFSEEG